MRNREITEQVCMHTGRPKREKINEQGNWCKLRESVWYRKRTVRFGVRKTWDSIRIYLAAFLAVNFLTASTSVTSAMKWV